METRRLYWLRWNHKGSLETSLSTTPAPETNFMRYLRGVVFSENPRDFFSAWPAETMQRDSPLWDMPSDEKHLYVIHNPNLRLGTQVGYARDLTPHLSHRRRRPQNDEIWILIFYVVLPPLRNWRVDELRRHSTGKGVSLRTQRLLAKALDMHLDWRLAIDAIDRTSELYMPDVVETLRAANLLTSSRLRDHLIQEPDLESRLANLTWPQSEAKRRRL